MVGTPATSLSDYLRRAYAEELAARGELFARVTVREIRHPAIKSGPDDDLADFKISSGSATGKGGQPERGDN
jgi:hypothetical protein